MCSSHHPTYTKHTLVFHSLAGCVVNMWYKHNSFLVFSLISSFPLSPTMNLQVHSLSGRSAAVHCLPAYLPATHPSFKPCFYKHVSPHQLSLVFSCPQSSNFIGDPFLINLPPLNFSAVIHRSGFGSKL